MTAMKSIKDVAVDVIRKSMFDPDWFASNILLMPNDPFQSELMNAIADLDRIKYGLPTRYNHEGKNRFSVRSCHGTGKTHSIAKTMHWFNGTRKGRIAVTAPKERQVTTRVWPEFRKILANSIEDYKKVIKAEKTQIMWRGKDDWDPDWVALVEAASRSENLSGLHDDNLLFLVEEASGIDESMFPSIEGSLSTEGSVLVMIGNPTRVEGEFYNSHKKPGTMELYYTMHVRPEDSPRVTDKYINDMRRKYGENSPVFKVRCLGEFSEMVANQLIALGWIDDARGARKYEDGSIPKKRMSVDVGDGEDDSVVTICTHYNSYVLFEKQYKFNFPSSESPILLAQKVMELWDLFGFKVENGDDIVVDSLGVGAGTAGYLIQEEKYNVIAYKGGEGSDDSTEWKNRRTQSYICMRDAFRDKHVVIEEDFYDDPDDWEDLYGELVSIKSKPGIEKVEELEPKKLLKKSPNKADSLAMQYATQVPVLGTGNEEIILTGSLEANNYDASLNH